MSLVTLAVAFIQTLVVWVLQIVIAVSACAISIYGAVHIFDKSTTKVKEWEEIKKGNVAVAILLGGVIFSIIMIILPAVSHLLYGVFSIDAFHSTFVFAIVTAINLINLAISLIVATVVVAFSFKIIDAITKDIDEQKEIKNGNIAVALLTAFVLVSSAILVKEVVAHMLTMVDAYRIAELLLK